MQVVASQLMKVYPNGKRAVREFSAAMLEGQITCLLVMPINAPLIKVPSDQHTQHTRALSNITTFKNPQPRINSSMDTPFISTHPKAHTPSHLLSHLNTPSHPSLSSQHPLMTTTLLCLLQGHNGAGKSTVISMITGLTTMTAGK